MLKRLNIFFCFALKAIFAILFNSCVIRGCVPKKLLMYGSKFQHEFESSKGFGWTIPSEPHHDWSTLIRNKNKELERLTNAYRNTLKNAKVEIIEGRGIVC